MSSKKLDTKILDELKEQAKEASKNSYSPYSKFPVGAAILTESGKIYSGCNVENASYGLSNCAERTAIFKAASEGQRSLLAIAIYTPTQTTTAPCGACRQVIYEFGPECTVINICDNPKNSITATMDQILPRAFGPKDLL